MIQKTKIFQILFLIQALFGFSGLINASDAGKAKKKSKKVAVDGKRKASESSAEPGSLDQDHDIVEAVGVGGVFKPLKKKATRPKSSNSSSGTAKAVSSPMFKNVAPSKASMYLGYLAKNLTSDSFFKRFPTRYCGILLHGPSGCGKTFLAEELYKCIGMSFDTIFPVLAHGRSLPDQISSITKFIVETDVSGIIVENVDVFKPHKLVDGSQRDDLIGAFEGALACSGICVFVGTTQNIEKVHPQVRKLFVYEIPVTGLRDVQERVVMIRAIAARLGIKFDPRCDINKVARQTVKYTPRGLHHLLCRAELASKVERGSRAVIMFKDLESNMKKTVRKKSGRSSVSPHMHIYS